jgi:hypothetical protein
MAINIGTPAQNKVNPGNSKVVTFDYTMIGGSDTLLVVAIQCPSTKNISTVKYNGVAMTSRLNYSSSQLSARYGFWELENPASGTNEVRVDYNVNLNNTVLTRVQGFSGATGGGVVGNNDIANSPHSRTRTGITAGSLMMVQAVATNSHASNAITVGSETIPSQAHQGDRNQRVGCSTVPLTAGSVVVVTKASATYKKPTNSTLEIKAASTSTVTRNRIHIT